jgi:predicted branched-subunit amino acid permease
MAKTSMFLVLWLGGRRTKRRESGSCFGAGVKVLGLLLVFETAAAVAAVLAGVRVAVAYVD